MENGNRGRIIQVAHKMFNARGYRSVTIKELADELGMSKKTIYQYFSSKEEIATSVVEECMRRLDEVSKITDIPDLDPQDAIKEILMRTKEETLRLGPLFLMDIEKYLPELANRYNVFRSEKKELINEFLKKAQHMDLIKDIPTPLVTEILSVCLKSLARSDSFSQLGYSTSYVLDVFLDIFGKGIQASSIEKSECE
ncbi:MAG: TetR/AcrR family transcriptional regulator [Desulfitobacterium sp.]|nr:TetR/AcrR family transcriptional regulator [Desulfitobacterium sp.]